MNSKLYVGNLPFSVTEEELREVFGAYGTLTDVSVITDRETGRPRGFGFITFETGETAQAAQAALDGSELGGRALRVNEAQDTRRSSSFRGNNRY